ncbi:MAG: hypothetical protein RLZZ436_985, partial [Planctomycetota bacterium]
MQISGRTHGSGPAAALSAVSRY